MASQIILFVHPLCIKHCIRYFTYIIPNSYNCLIINSLVQMRKPRHWELKGLGQSPMMCRESSIHQWDWGIPWQECWRKGSSRLETGLGDPQDLFNSQGFCVLNNDSMMKIWREVFKATALRCSKPLSVLQFSFTKEQSLQAATESSGF